MIEFECDAKNLTAALAWLKKFPFKGLEIVMGFYRDGTVRLSTALANDRAAVDIRTTYEGGGPSWFGFVFPAAGITFPQRGTCSITIELDRGVSLLRTTTASCSSSVGGWEATVAPHDAIQDRIAYLDEQAVAAIKDIAWCASRDTSRDYLQGVMLRCQNGYTDLCATNTHVLATYRDEVSPGDAPGLGFIPSWCLPLLAPAVNLSWTPTGKGSPITVNFSTTFGKCKLDIKSGVTVDTRLLDLYRGHIPQHSVEFVRSYIPDMVRAVKAWPLEGKLSRVNLDLAARETEVRAISPNGDTFSIALPAAEVLDRSAKPMEIGVSREYFLKTVSLLDKREGTTQLDYDDEESAMRFTSDKRPGLEFFVMPMQ